MTQNRRTQQLNHVSTKQTKAFTEYIKVVRMGQIESEEPSLWGEVWQQQFQAVHLIQLYTQCDSQ